MADNLFGDRLSGILDALAGSDETIATAVHLLLPYAGVFTNIANAFIWWGLLFSIAWTIAKLVMRQTKPDEIAGKLGLAIVIFVCFIPVQVVPGSFGRLPLASFVTWKAMSTVDNLFREGVNELSSNLTRNGRGLPLSMVHTLNNDSLGAIEGSYLAPIISDYVANCTYATTLENEYGERLSQTHWRSVGLLGTGGLGFEKSNYQGTGGYVSDTLVKLFSFGTIDLEEMRDKAADWESWREEAIKILNRVDFPQSIGSGYKLPTSEYWKARIIDTKVAETDSVETLTLPKDARYLATHDHVEYERTGKEPEDLKRWHADNCYELYRLAHLGTRSYLEGLSEHYQVSMKTTAYNLSSQDAVAAGGAALGEAMRTYYRRAANIEAGAGGPGAKPVNGSFVSNDSEYGSDFAANGWGSMMGSINELAAMLLNINLDQLIIVSLGSLSIAIAFLAVMFPLFALMAPISGGGAITLPLKMMIMLELTLMLSYAVATVGILLLAALNTVATNSSYGAYSIGTSTANLTVAVMTGMFIFPFIAAKLAHVVVFGSAGVRAADGQTISAGKQAALAAVVMKAVAAVAGGAAGMTRLSPLKMPAPRSGGGGTGLALSGGRPPVPQSGAPKTGPSQPRLPSNGGGRLAAPASQGQSRLPAPRLPRGGTDDSDKSQR